MAISSVTPPINSITATPASDSAVSALVQNARKNQDQQPSAIVSVSKQAQQLNQADTQSKTSQSQTAGNVDTIAAENTENKAKEAAEPPGIQFMEGESKGGRVNTFA